jgi:spore germination protein GerM
MNKKIIYSLVILALIFFITSLLIFLKSGGEPKDKELQPLESKTGEETEEPKMVKVKAFFFTEASRFMRPVEYEIQLPEVKEHAYRTFLELLLKGEENYITPVPEGVTLRSLYFIENKSMLVVDFSEELIRRFPSGTDSELEFIYFIVDNVCYNFEEIKKVKFLISGNEYRTISGHIDIENAFYPDYRYLYLREQ